jgi:hypothetical protein
MVLQPISTGNSQSSNYNQINDMVRQLNKEQTTKVFRSGNNNAIITGKLPYDGGYGTLYYDANGIPAIEIGILPDGGVGLKIAKSGVDVTTATDDNLNFNSSQNVLQVSESGIAHLDALTVTSLLFDANQVTINFTKTYASVPIVLGYILEGNSYRPWQAGSIIPINLTPGTGTGIKFSLVETPDQFTFIDNVVFYRAATNGTTVSQTFSSYDIAYFVLKQSISDPTS